MADEENTQNSIQTLVPDEVSVLSPFRIGLLNKDSKILEISAVLSAFGKADGNFKYLEDQLSGMNDEVKFLLNTRDIIGQMIVTQLSTWYYDTNEVLHAYSSLRSALAANPTFEGKVNYAQDVNLTSGSLQISQRKITVDLNGHSLSCSRSSLVTLAFGGELTIQNGTIYLPKVFEDDENHSYGEEDKFVIFQGRLVLKNVRIDADLSKNGYIWDYTMFYLTQDRSEIELNDHGRSYLEIDKNCSIDMHEANLGECMICTFSPFYILTVRKYNGSPVMTAEEFWNRFGTAETLMPTVTVDGNVRMTCSDSMVGQVEMYPSLITGNGQDRLDTVINIENNARIYAQGHGIYLGNRGTININGSATIIGGTGICMRSGTLNIPLEANPTIIGIAEPMLREIDGSRSISGFYDPLHSLKQSGDWGMNLNLGHAILLENNGPSSYGAKPASANIRSGTLISYHNTAIGSYGIATTSTSGVAAGQSQQYTYVPSGKTTAEAVTKTLNFFERPTNFASGIQVSKREAQKAYEYRNGENPDYGTAVLSSNPSLNAVKFEDGASANLSSDFGIARAVKDILVLLGMKESNIVLPQGGSHLMNADPGEPPLIDPSLPIEDLTEWPDIGIDDPEDTLELSL